MMDSLRWIVEQIKRIWGKLNPNQRMVVSAASTAALVGLIVLVFWARHTNYAVLYSGLDPQEAAVIVEKLKKDKIPYTLSGNGTTVMVPSKEVYDLRLQLAGEGLPRTGIVGYEIFDKTNLGMTDFLQKVNYRRALEGELTKTIQGLSEVQAARVHIVIPQPSLFRESQKEAAASIMLKLKPPSSLRKSQIQGITSLVASSVEGLKPSNITIVDYNGTLLSNGTGKNQLSALSQDQFEIQRNVEAYLEEKAQSLLDGVIGPKKSMVRVTADLNFERIEETIEQYDPEGTVIRSEQRIEENSPGSSGKENTVINYEVNKTIQHIVSSVGNIKKLSVALMIDPNTTDGDGLPVTRSQQEIGDLSGIVKKAVGFVAGRDEFEVASISFDKSALLMEQRLLDRMERRQFWTSVARKVGKLLAAIFAFFVLRFVIKALAREAARRKKVVAKETVAGPSPEEEVRGKVFAEVSAAAKQRPQEAARLIRTMLEEEYR